MEGGENGLMYLDIEAELPSREKRYQLCSIPTSQCESDGGLKLNRQGFSLDMKPHFLTLKSSGFRVLRLNFNGFFPNESFFVPAFIHLFFSFLQLFIEHLLFIQYCARGEGD